MKRTRRNHSAVFKAKVALAALKGDKTLAWATRRVLSWRLSNSMTTDFCIEAVEEAVQRQGPPGIFNTDQGSQFTRTEFVSLIQGHGIQVSMDGKVCKAISSSTMNGARIPRLTAKRPIACTLSRCLPNKQPKPQKPT